MSAWLLVFGKAGPVNQLYRTATGATGVLIDIYSMPGMVVVEGFLWSPLAFLLVGATLRNANPELEEAARVKRGGAWAGDHPRRVTMRLSLLAILALSMLVFIRAIEAFEVPALVGLPGRISVLTTDIYTNMMARAPPDLGGSSALSVLMLILVLGLLYVYARLSRNAERFATITGKGFRPRPFDLGRLRYVAAAILVIDFVLLLLVPMLMLGWISLLPFFAPVSAASFKLLSLNNYRTVLASSEDIDLLINTLIVAVATATPRGGAYIPGGLAFGQARAGWLAGRPARHHPAGVSRPGARRRRHAGVPAPADPALWHAWYPDLGLRHQLPALRHALQLLRNVANPPRAGGSGGDLRRLAGDAAAADRGAAAGARPGSRVALRLPDGDARPLAGDPARRAAFADHGGCDVRSLGQWGKAPSLQRSAWMWSMLMAMIAVIFYALARRSAGGGMA